MKKSNLAFSLVFSLAVTSLLTLSSAHAKGGGSTGGGDQCKNEIDKDRLAIQGWIARDEAKGLDLSLARVPGWTYNDPAPAKSYKKSMLSVLEEGKVVVTCYLDPARISDPAAKKIAEAEGVSYKTITIGNPPKPTTCVNYEDNDGVSHIDCNYDLVMASTGNPDFVTTHHEYASIAGVEMRTDTYTSDFSISNQLSQFEHWQQVKLLGPKSIMPLSGAAAAIKINYTLPEGEVMYSFSNDDDEQTFITDLLAPTAGALKPTDYKIQAVFNKTIQLSLVNPNYTMEQVSFELDNSNCDQLESLLKEPNVMQALGFAVLFVVPDSVASNYLSDGGTVNHTCFYYDNNAKIQLAAVVPTSNISKSN